MEKVKAVLMVAPGRIEIGEHQLPPLGSRDVLVETKVSGICMFDIKVYTGQHKLTYPFIGGHEAVGVVKAVGTGVESVKVGDMVTTLASYTFAEKFVTSASHVRPIGEVAEDSLAAWISEPARCAVVGANANRVVVGDNVVIIGCGYMGLLHLQLLPSKLMSKLVAVDLKPHNLELARKFGATHTLNPNESSDIVGAIQKLCPEGVDLVVEAVGSGQSIDLATQIVRHGGTINLFGYAPGSQMVDTATWHMKGLTVLNTAPSFSPNLDRDFDRAVRAMKLGVIDQKDLMTHGYDICQAQQALDEIVHRRPDNYIKGYFRF